MSVNEFLSLENILLIKTAKLCIVVVLSSITNKEFVTSISFFYLCHEKYFTLIKIFHTLKYWKVFHDIDMYLFIIIYIVFSVAFGFSPSGSQRCIIDCIDEGRFIFLISIYYTKDSCGSIVSRRKREENGWRTSIPWNSISLCAG